ncbi:MAG: carbohydrate ABC transporter substrate-binding protein, partial [Spirochaetia bacterium]
MKKTIMFLLVLTVGVLVFAGGQNEEASSTPKEEKAVELVVWGGVPGENGPDEAAAKYNAINENVKVKYVRYVNDDQGNVKLDTALVAGEKID